MSDFLDAEKQLKTDSLTGLYDRQVVIEYANSLIKKNVPFSIALVDVDNFKNVNDNYGHAAGDRIICSIAKKLKENIDGKGIAGRFGGDEFILVIKNIAEYDDLWRFCRGLFKNIDGLTLKNIPGCYITCTSGLTRFPTDGNSYDVLMEKTDKALYRGKQKGRSCFIIYLDSKHKNIVLHTENDKTVNPMQRVTIMYKLLNMQSSLKDGILAILNNFSSTMMIDHLSLQSKDKLLFSIVHPLSRHKEFSFISDEIFKFGLNNINGIFYINERQQLEALKQENLLEIFSRQEIKSTAYAVIKYNSHFYGYLRADTTNHARIWQNDDLQLLVTAANAIATALHYQNLELDDLQ